MKKFIWLLLSAVFVAPGIGFAATNAPPTAPLVSSGPCAGSTCPGNANDNTHPFLIDAISGTRLALDASIQQIVGILNAPLSLPTNAATSALQSTGNGFLSTLATASASQATAAHQTAVQSTPGTPQTTAVTVQGNVGGVPMPVSGSVTVASTGIAPITSTAAESSHILKASSANLYSVIVTPTVSGYLMVFNAVSAPSDGAVTPAFCIPVSANTSGGVSSKGGIPATLGTGAVVVFSITGCFTKTASATAIFQAMVQ